MEEGNDMAASSGFSDPLTLDSKYYNKYTNNDPSLACNGNECLSVLCQIVGIKENPNDKIIN